jgi:membrane protease YdiL (CAAX protease family)
MLCVGVIEEVIFRGFLFRAMSKDNLIAAIIVSSITFGFGHIVNLLSGAEVLSTLLQIAYATAAGFMFTILFYKSGSLLPCIAAHGLVNAASVFACKPTLTLELITAGVLIVLSVGYALWILYLEKTDKKNAQAEE